MRKIHNPKSNSPAVYIPCWLLQVSTNLISNNGKILYGRLSQWSNEEGIVFRSCSQLSEEIGSSIRSIERYIKELKDVGLIGTYHPQAGCLNYFEFYDHEWMYLPINKQLVYKSPRTATFGFDQISSKYPPTDMSVPPDKCGGTPPTNVADINSIEIKEITTTTIDQILTTDFLSEPVVVNSISSTSTPTPTPEIESNIFISQELDKLLMDAYKKLPVKTKNIKDELDFLSACKYSIEHRPEGISKRGRVKQQIRFVLENTFEEPLEWAQDIVKKRNARIAEATLKLNEENTVKKSQEQMRHLNIIPGREGFAATLAFLNKKDDSEICNPEARRVYKPCRLPEELNLK